MCMIQFINTDKTTDQYTNSRSNRFTDQFNQPTDN